MRTFFYSPKPPPPSFKILKPLLVFRNLAGCRGILSGAEESCRVPTSTAVLIERNPAVLSSIRQLLAINSLLSLSFIRLLIISLLVYTKFTNFNKLLLFYSSHCNRSIVIIFISFYINYN